jgi:shikimate kinase
MTIPTGQIQDIGLQNVNVYLIGLMGSGKTTTGQLLAQQLGYQFLDTDTLIEQVAGCTINEIFAQSGEAEFRDLETQVLSEVSAYKRLVIATGGGIVLKPTNWSYLHHGIIVWLNVALEHLAARLTGDQSRPLLAVDAHPTVPENVQQQSQFQARLQKLQALWGEREHLYRQADVEITIMAEQEATDVVSMILATIPTVLRSAMERSTAADLDSAEGLETLN